jgi:hypothetical protein
MALGRTTRELNMHIHITVRNEAAATARDVSAGRLAGCWVDVTVTVSISSALSRSV